MYKIDKFSQQNLAYTQPSCWLNSIFMFGLYLYCCMYYNQLCMHGYPYIMYILTYI